MSVPYTAVENYDLVKPKALAKYGLQFRGMEIVGRLGNLIGKGHGQQIGIIITLDDE